MPSECTLNLTKLSRLLQVDEHDTLDFHYEEFWQVLAFASQGEGEHAASWVSRSSGTDTLSP